MNLEDFEALKVPESMNIIAGLPPPESSPIAINSNSAELTRVLNHASSLIGDLLTNHAQCSTSPIKYTCPNCTNLHDLDASDAWQRVCTVLVAYVSFYMCEFMKLEKVGDEDDVPNTLKIDFVSQLLERQEKRQGKPKYHLAYLALIVNGLLFYTISYVLKYSRMSGTPESVRSDLEKLIHSYSYEIAIVSSIGASRDFTIAKNRLITDVLNTSKGIYEINSWANANIEKSAFSLIRLDILNRLAQRDSKLISHLGKDKLEKYFEQQLSLIAQSFGFKVTASRRGKAQVDLICLCNNGQENNTILIEAKTSRKNYSLKKDDERALQDYIRDIKSTSYIPPLRLVLVIGPASSKVLEKKLKILSNSISVPIKFMAAQQLAKMRDGIVGPIMVKIFFDNIMQENHIVSDQFVKTVINAHKLEHDAHAEYINKLVDRPANVQPAKRSWPTQH